MQLHALCIAPSGIPNIQEITNVTSHSVNIRFEKIPSQLRNGILRGYKVLSHLGAEYN